MRSGSLVLLGVALAVLPFAGCQGTATLTQDAAPSVPTALFNFGDEILVASAPGGVENFVAVSPDGMSILTCQHNTYVRAGSASSSTDRGRTWVHHDPFPQPLPGGDCDVAIDPVTGTWYVATSHTANGNSVAVSRDSGKTWEVHLLASQPTNSRTLVMSNDREWIEAWDGTAYLATMAPFVFPGHIGMAVSKDDGRTWAPTTTITTGPPLDSHVHGPSQRLPAGTMVHPVFKHATSEGPNNGGTARMAFVLVRSADRGTTWAEEEVLAPTMVTGGVPNFAITGDGTMIWVFGVAADGGNQLMAIARRPGEAEWSRPVKIAEAKNGPVFGHGWIDGRGDGTADLVWQGDAEGLPGAAKGPHLIIARIGPDGRISAGPQALVPLPDLNEFVTADHDAGGRMVITFSRATAVFTPAEPDAGSQYVLIEKDGPAGPPGSGSP